MKKYSYSFCSLFMALIVLFCSTNPVHADKENVYKQRLALYKKTEIITNVPWYYLAAMDQYERNKEHQRTEDEAVISIHFPDELWYGIGNPGNQTNHIVQFFQGIGQDGNGDGKADPANDEDILMAAAHLLTANGVAEEDIRISLWRYYKRDLSVKTIMNTARVLKHFNTNELTDRSFPVDTSANYSYQSTWGDRRGFGGNRIHEGTDVFANYGTPVVSTTYGVVELMGWNLYGGWRIGIRDIYNIYHYYAHLENYDTDINIGEIVKPGDPLGTIGATGYGPPGTSGKFPPHLHYGMYKDDGKNDWSFDQYPYLQKWEKKDKDT